MIKSFITFIKSAIYITAFTAVSIAGSVFIHAAIAAWSAPQQSPPDGNVALPWTKADSNIYPLTLTDYVGIGTGSPNRQLHIKTAAGNAELDIQSGAQNYWALYHDAATEQLRFWNADFSGDIGAGAGNTFVIDNDGTILVKTPLAGDSDNAVATKGYVDAQAGGGDATLANQTSILANQASLSGGQNSILNAVQQLQLDSGFNNWVQGSATYYSVGGSNAFCRQHVVDANGHVSTASINNGAVCDSAAGLQCSNGDCNTLLIGGTHGDEQCVADGGSVYDTGSGLICRFSASSCPGGWIQHNNWQRYSSISWGAVQEGDDCGRWVDSGPIASFANQISYDYDIENPCTDCPLPSGCNDYPNVCPWYPTKAIWCDGQTQGQSPVYDVWDPVTVTNTAVNRAEVGCK